MTPNERIREIEDRQLALKHELDLAHVEFAKELRARRLEAQESLRQFAERLGISAPYIHDLEQGNRHASFRLREAIEKI